MGSHAMIGITFGLLALAIATAWSTRVLSLGGRRWPWWMPLLAAAMASGWWSGFLQLPGILVLLVLIGLARADQEMHPASAARLVISTAMVVLAAALAAHVVPGFANPVLLQAYRFSSDAVPYTQHANFDKGAAGLILLAYCCRPGRAGSLPRQGLWRVLPVALVTGAAVISGAVLLDYARLDIKLPPYTPVFLALNLFFTCVAEEALFRGVLQHRLAQVLTRRGLAQGGAIAVLVVAAVFGAVHTGGGMGYVILATLAGLGYGYAYQSTGRIEASILVHFAVNAVHFIGFTYPRLA